MKRAYSMSQWHQDFAKAFTAGYQFDSLPTQARGSLLVAAQDEKAAHITKRERVGFGPDGKARVICSCGHCGEWREESDDWMASKLASDAAEHRRGGAL